jgi:hypothetical protein
MKVTSTRVEFEDKDFTTQYLYKSFTGENGIEIRCIWADACPVGVLKEVKRKFVEVHARNPKWMSPTANRSGERPWIYRQFLEPGETSKPIHGVTFVNRSKK